LADSIAYPIVGAPLPHEANVYRALRLESFSPEGDPTEAHFIMKKKHRTEEGPSHGICDLIPREHAERLFHPQRIAKLNVSEMVNPSGGQSLSERGVVVIPYRDAKSDEFYKEYAEAHAVLTGYQDLTNKELNEFKRHLASLAKKALEADKSTTNIDPPKT